MNAQVTPRRGRLRYALVGYLLRALGPAAGPLMRRSSNVDSLPAVADLVRFLEAWARESIPVAAGDHERLVQSNPALGRVRYDDLPTTIDGRIVPARLYRIPSAEVREGLVWVHGGAFLMGDLDMPESHWVCLAIAAAGIPVIALDYSKALHGRTYLASNQDVLAGWRHGRRVLQGLGVLTDNVHFGGASAGANLVTCATKRLRDLQEPLPASLQLIYPLLHSRLPKLSYELLSRVRSDRRAICFEPHWVADLALHYAGSSQTDPYAFAANGDLSGLPPTFLLNCEIDMLRVSGEAFADQLVSAGCVVHRVLEPGAVHGCLNTPGSAEADRVLSRMVGWLTSRASL